jgi:hypothetical protein
MIMASAVYRQSSQYDEAKGKIDSDNRLCWRRPPHRLEAEVIRDALLAVSGMLDDRMYGLGTLDEASRRRSIYFTVKRSKLVPMMQVFDAPEALGGVGERPTSTIAPQALLLMNNPQVRDYARHLARRISAAGQTSDAAIQRAYLLTLARKPTAQELSDATGFLLQQSQSYKADGPELALTDFCQTLMCLNEFVYVD